MNLIVPSSILPLPGSCKVFLIGRPMFPLPFPVAGFLKGFPWICRSTFPLSFPRCQVPERLPIDLSNYLPSLIPPLPGS